MASISLHYSGDIVIDHKITLLTLSKTVSCLQNAINRAHLDNKHGGTWKHARISAKDYEEIAFWVGPAEPGGYILNAVSSTGTGKLILDRISRALQPIFSKVEKGILEESLSLADQAKAIESTLSKKTIQNYPSFVEATKRKSENNYGDRAILKEIDEMTSPLRSEDSGKSLLDLTLDSTSRNIFSFNPYKSKLFHSLVSARALAAPVHLQGKIDKLDRANLNGRFVNAYNNKKCTIYFGSDESFLTIHPYLARRHVEIIASPILEYGAYDISAGDLYFIELG